jgi:hypothetical protein
MAKYDRYGRRQESIPEKIGDALSDLTSNIQYSISSASDNIHNFLSPPKKNYGYNSYYKKPKSGIDWGFVATRGALSAAIAFTATTAIQATPGAWQAFTNRQVSSAEPADNIKNPNPLPTDIPATNTPETPSPKSEYQGGITLNYNDEGTLVSYQTKSGETVAVDPEKIKALKETAATTHETQIIAVLDEPKPIETKKDFEQTDEKPIVSELPKDIVSDEELSLRGIKIIQTPGGTKLSIRKAAFNDGELLGNYKTKGDQKLTIVLVDNGYLSTTAMDDSRYDNYKDIIKKNEAEVYTYRQTNIARFEGYLETTRTELQKAIIGNDPETAELLDLTLLSIKLQILKYQQATDAQIRIEAGITDMAGLYCTYSADGHPIIYIAVGNTEITETNQNSKIILIDPKGQIQIQEELISAVNLNLQPTLEQSFPSPDDFKSNSDTAPSLPGETPDNSYLYGGQSAGFAFRHELEHNLKIVQNPTGDPSFDQSEYRTDQAAMETIKKAYDNWISNGDNSLYYFVFTNPDGSIILTNNLQPEKPTI